MVAEFRDGRWQRRDLSFDCRGRAPVPAGCVGNAHAPVTTQSPIYHFTPNRDFLFSRDWDMVLANRGRINNAGFVNDQDYRKDDRLPLLAMVGDSMIEAAMLAHRDTVQGRLADALAGSCEHTVLLPPARRSANI